MGRRDRDAVAFLREMAFRAMKELATMLRGFLDDLGNLCERVVKRLMQEENRVPVAKDAPGERERREKWILAAHTALREIPLRAEK